MYMYVHYKCMVVRYLRGKNRYCYVHPLYEIKSANNSNQPTEPMCLRYIPTGVTDANRSCL